MCPSKTLERSGWSEDTVLIRLLLGGRHGVPRVLLGNLGEVVLLDIHVTTHGLLNARRRR